MDEPLSNLDAKLRVQMRAEISRLQHDLGVTTIYVTHDQVEAMTMGDRVAVMRKGELQQVADPQTLYDRPVNLFVGGFIGSPAMNMLEATLERANGASSRSRGTQRIALDDETLARAPGARRLRGAEASSSASGPRTSRTPRSRRTRRPDRRLTGRSSLREALGSEIMVHFRVDARPALTEESRELAEDVGDDRGGAATAADADERDVVGRFGARSRVQRR